MYFVAMEITMLRITKEPLSYYFIKINRLL